MTADVDSLPFFEALERGVIMIQICTQCRSPQFPPRAMCVTCGGAPEWSEIDGSGIIYSVTTCHRPGETWLSEAVPYSVALVDLRDGIRMLGRVIGEPVEHDAIGLAVRAHVTSDPRGVPTVEFGFPSAEGAP